MADLLFPISLRGFLTGDLGFLYDPVRIALVDGYTPDPRHSTWADVAPFEISAPGYRAGGQMLVSKRVEPVGDQMALLAADAVWAPATLKASGAVIFKSADLPQDQLLVSYIDFGRQEVCVNSEFRIQFTEGIVTLGYSNR